MSCAEKTPSGRPCVLEGEHTVHRAAPQRDHHCHAIGCDEQVPPEMLMCLRHWRKVPKKLQKQVWATYRHGQCEDLSPSKLWLKAADAAIKAVAKKEGLL